MAHEIVKINENTFGSEAAWNTISGFRYSSAENLENGRDARWNANLSLIPGRKDENTKRLGIFNSHNKEFKALEEMESSSPEYKAGIIKFYAKLYEEYQNAPAKDKHLYQEVIAIYRYGQDIDKMQEKLQEGEKVSFQVPTKAEFAVRKNEALAEARRYYEMNERSVKEEQSIVQSVAEHQRFEEMIAPLKKFKNIKEVFNSIEPDGKNNSYEKNAIQVFESLKKDVALHPNHTDVEVPQTLNEVGTANQVRR